VCAVPDELALKLPTIERIEAELRQDVAGDVEATRDIIDYIVEVYNCQRLNSELSNRPPSGYERQMAEETLVRVSAIT
jgi:hypothetical protein